MAKKKTGRTGRPAGSTGKRKGVRRKGVRREASSRGRDRGKNLGKAVDGTDLRYDDTPANEPRDLQVETGHQDLDTRIRKEVERDRAKSVRRRPRQDDLNDVVGTKYSLTNHHIPWMTYRGRMRHFERVWPHRRLILDFVAPHITPDEVAFRREQAVAHDHLYVPVLDGQHLVEARSPSERNNTNLVALAEILAETWGADYKERLEHGIEPLPAGLGLREERAA